MASCKRRFTFFSLIPTGSRLTAAAVFMGCMAVQVSAQAQDVLSNAEVAQLLAESRQMVASGRTAEAYELLAPHELELAGNADFDYLYGTAALDSGEPQLAIFALERVLEDRPSFLGARLELARAFYDTGDNESARYHFEYLQAQNPPPNVQQAITSYLRAIDRLAAAYKPIHIPHFAMGGGWDSNANASTAVEQFLGFILDGNNQETDSPTYFATLGDYYSRPLSPDWKLILTGAVSQRNYPDASFVDSTDVYANVGFEWNLGDTKFFPTFGAAFNWLDGDDNLDRYISDFLVTHSVNDEWKLIGGVSASAHRFTSDLEIRDANVYNGRVGFEHYLDPATASVISAMVQVGTDDVEDDLSPFENDRYAVTLSASRAIAQGMLLTGDIGYKNTDYNGKTNFFGVDREDEMWRAGLTLNVFDWPWQGWRTIGRAAYTDVESEDPLDDLYGYDRTEVNITFHRSFE